MGIIVIAEAGVNHNGQIELARELIDAAVESGADFIKFQSFKANKLLTRKAPKADYQIKNTRSDEDQYAMIKKLELSEKMHSQIIDYCRERNIKFLSTGFDNDSVNFLVSCGLKILKIPSGEITNLPYLRHIGSLQKELILSTGMSNLDEIKEAIKILNLAGTPMENITLLHCSTDYPTSMKDVNLNAMDTMRKSFGVKVGYSDHTEGIEVAVAAAALGASVIEKHFTTDRNLPGPDHKASLEPKELKKMISLIRNIELALGNGIKQATSAEMKNKLIVRKSIVATRFIKSGEILSEENIAVKRPGNGISPMKWDDIVGSKAKRNFDIDDLIEI